jgi:hypothetical protein
MRDAFSRAAGAAIRLLTETVQNDGVKLEVRIDTALKMLDRAYGKPAPESRAFGDGHVTVELSPELEEFAR